MSNPPTYLASSGAHKGTSGFTNYLSCSGSNKARARARVFRDFPDAVIVNGDDDWGAALHTSPVKLARKFGVQPLAYYHTGISGLSKSGIVISEQAWDSIQKQCKRETGHCPAVTVYRLNRKLGGVSLSYGEDVINGKRFSLEAVFRLDGTEEWILQGAGARSRYVLQPTGDTVTLRCGKKPTFRLASATTKRPTSRPGLKDVRFVEKKSGMVRVGTPEAEKLEGWHGSCFYG